MRWRGGERRWIECERKQWRGGEGSGDLEIAVALSGPPLQAFALCVGGDGNRLKRRGVATARSNELASLLESPEHAACARVVLSASE